MTSSAATDASASPEPTGSSRRRPDLATLALLAVVAVDVVAGTFFRFYTTSKLWLDEAQTVNIASFPIARIPHELRLDGAPPLYYVLLHVWMGLVGTSDADVRALSGVFSLLTLPLLYWVVRKGFGRTESLAALCVVATSPFACYFAVETRMYSLVMLLVVAGLGAAQALLSKPTVPRAVLLAVVTGLLLYTHYWAFYLLVVAGAWFALVAWREAGTRRRGAAYALGALVVGALTFIPWVPTFLWQRAHTGTPWSSPPTLASAFGWFAGFVANQSVQDETLSLHIELGLLVFVVLVVFGFAAIPEAKDRLSLRLTGQPRARVLGFLAIGTLAVGWVASREANTAFEPRYSSVAFPFLAILIGLGIASLPTKWLQVALLAALSVLALWTTHWGALVQRTQAGKAAVVMRAEVPTGSIVAVCPDQLGPSLLRYAGSDDYRYVGYPRFANPRIVDWIDYQKAVDATSPDKFAARLLHLAGHSTFYVVWSLGYGFHKTCQEFVQAVTHLSGRTPTTLLAAQKYRFYQSMNVLEYAVRR